MTALAISLSLRCTSLSVFLRVAWLDMIIISDTAGSDMALTTASSSLISIYLELPIAHRTTKLSRYRLTDAYTDNVFPFPTLRDFTESTVRSKRPFELQTMKRHSFVAVISVFFFWDDLRRDCSRGSRMRLNKPMARPIRREGIKINLSRLCSVALSSTQMIIAPAVNAT